MQTFGNAVRANSRLYLCAHCTVLWHASLYRCRCASLGVLHTRLWVISARNCHDWVLQTSRQLQACTLHITHHYAHSFCLLTALSALVWCARDPSGTTLAFADMMKKQIVMPAHMMDDMVHKGRTGRNIFQDFSTVAESTGTYTAQVHC